MLLKLLTRMYLKINGEILNKCVFCNCSVHIIILLGNVLGDSRKAMRLLCYTPLGSSFPPTEIQLSKCQHRNLFRCCFKNKTYLSCVYMLWFL